MSQLSVNIAKAHAVRTDATYNSGLRAWFSFCHSGALPNLLTREAVPDPLEAELIIMLFAQHLFNGGTVNAKKTIPVYLAAVRDYHVKRIGIVPWRDALRLPLFLKSLARLDSRRVQKRAAVTLRILRLWRPLFDLRRRQHLIWWTAMVVAFMGLFRKSEFCLLDGMRFDCLRNLCRGDASFQRVVVNGAVVSMELHVKFYKNEQLGTGTAVPFRRIGGDYCPVELVMALLEAFPLLPASAPLFPGGANYADALRASEFTKLVARLVASTPELQGVRLLPHSFRIGGAMALYEAGAPDSVIMMMGRWKSAAFLVYLRSCREVILHWNQVVASGSRTTTSRVLGIDQAEAALASLRVTQEFESCATSPVLGVVSGRGATSM